MNSQSDPEFQINPSPGSTSAYVPGPADISLLGGAKLPREVGTVTTPTISYEDDYDVTIANLPEKLGLSPEFLEELAKVGGNGLDLCHKLLHSHSTEGKSFRARQQHEFYCKTLDAGPMVSRWLKIGYEIPFSKVPKKLLSAPNNKSCLTNMQFACEVIDKQVKARILSEVNNRPRIINLISCVYSNKWCLVVDCRLLNPFLVCRKTKLEDLSLISSVVSEGDFMSTKDLEKGYWQVSLKPNDRKFIGISLDGKCYVANVLILGICDTLFAFTKIVRPIIRYLRSCGIKVLVYR